MTMRTIVFVAALLSVGSMVHAQEPVVGVKDPEALFRDPDPTLNRNKQATLRIMRELWVPDAGKASEILALLGLEPSMRPEVVSPHDFVRLFRATK